MPLTTQEITLSIIRGIIVTAVIYFFGNFVNKYKAKSKFWKKVWERDIYIREWMVKYYWAWGLFALLISLVIYWIW